MPGKSTKRNVRKPRRKTTRRRRIDPAGAVIRSPSGMPDKLSTKLRYSQYVSLADAVGGFVKANVFAGNSCYDPDQTGSGHQPYYFDEWGKLYQKYMVTGCSIKCNFASAAGNTKGVWVGIMAKSVSTTTTDITAANERAYVRDAVITPSGGGSNKTLSMYQTTRRILATGKITTTNSDYGALIAANPSLLWYYDIVAGSVDQSSVFGVDCTVELKYYVTFYDRKIAAQS